MDLLLERSPITLGEEGCQGPTLTPERAWSGPPDHYLIHAWQVGWAGLAVGEGLGWRLIQGWAGSWYAWQGGQAGGACRSWLPAVDL